MKQNFRTYGLAVEFYKAAIVLRLSRHLKEQLLRASSSIALNLAEGAGRETPADRRRFYTIAMGSLRESQAILDLSICSNKDRASSLADKLGGHLYRLIEATRG